MLNFVAVDLQLYKIVKIMRVSFFLAHSVVYMLRVFFCALLCMVQSLRRTSYS